MNKNIKSLSGLITLALLITLGLNCNKFLDRKPLTATLNDINGVTEQQALGFYSTLRGYTGFNVLPWLDFNCIRDDDAEKGSSSTDGAEINAEFETFKYTKDDWATNTYWNDHYYLIAQANQLLFYARDSLKLTDENSLRNIGEAHFFRAYSFFELVKAYGEVPLLNFYFINPADGLLPKSSVDDIYAQIDKDLDTAAQLLPVNWFNDITNQNVYPGRVTSGAAYTLWAQTYLFRKQWSKVVEVSNKVIGSGEYSLLDNFKDVWQDGVNGIGKNSKESIFEIGSTVGQNGANTYDAAWGTCQNVRVEGSYPDRNWDLGWGWNTPAQKLVNDWDSTDPRRNQTILFSGRYDGGPTQGGYGATLPPYVPDYGLDRPYWNKKVYSDPAMRAYTGHLHDASWISHRVMRYADVLLMLAEASNELGDGGTAAARLEEVRARARKSGTDPNAVPYIPFTGQPQMRQAIKDERRWEFAMEGYRFYDLVRWDDAQTVLGPLGYTPRCNYYPIPQPVLNLNSNLTQNPLWQ